MSSDAPIKLRELEPEDIAKLNEWRNDKQVIDLLGNNFFFIAQKIDEEWYNNYLNNRSNSVRLAIEATDSRNYIGNVNLTSVHSVNRSAEFSIMIGNRDYWGKGLGTLASRMVLEHAFLSMNLNRVWLTVLKKNERALRMYRSLGFKEEGVERQAIFKDGKFEDAVLMGLLREEFE